MSNDSDGFIQLNRTFYDLPSNEEEATEAELLRSMGRAKAAGWSDLLKDPRVVLLSAAGSGKSWEIRHACRELRRRGSYAFYLRIEHLTQDFEGAFEEGTPEEFERWLVSDEKGWVLLDSVDEARLKAPTDFEHAIRLIGRKLRGALERSHIVITSRAEAWRPKTDRALCQKFLPWTPPSAPPDPEKESDGHPRSDDDLSSQAAKPMFRMVTLGDLTPEQVDCFAAAKGVSDTAAFRRALDRAEAGSFTTRPLDLAEAVEFWLAEGRIGSRLDLLRASIDKRLDERDQDRAEFNPISKERIREGARLVAAASTLAKESAIRVPDGHENDRGLDIKVVLNDWDDAHCRTLLTRPIFDEGIYGTVRFHHRSVKEFLTAEWFHSLLSDEASRPRIENLFFRRQYGVEVVVPTLRPVLPWLSILDPRLLERVMRVAPEVLFEGGDPSQLPLGTRSRVLRDCCTRMAEPAHDRSTSEYSAVQRFANPDLAEVIRELLTKHADDDDVLWFLLRMVHQGGIQSLLPEAKRFAVDSRSTYTRIAAIRAVIEVGNAQDFAEIRNAFVAEPPPLRRRWLAELISGLGDAPADVAWLLAALERTAPRKRFDADGLAEALGGYVATVSQGMLAPLLDGIGQLLEREPSSKHRHQEISQQSGWLLQTAAPILTRMIKGRNPATLERPALAALSKLAIVKEYGRRLHEGPTEELRPMVREWAELNRAHFWHCVAEERVRRQRERGERLNDYWNVAILDRYWDFDGSDFDYIVQQVTHRPVVDDRLVAVTVGLALYQKNGRPREWLKRLQKAVSTTPEVESRFNTLLKPPKNAAVDMFRRHEADWKRRDERSATKRTQQRERYKQIPASRLLSIREFGVPGKDQHYLHLHLQSDDDERGRRTRGNWRSLIEPFGEPVARAFRDGAVGYWRRNVPRLRSEGAVPGKIPFTTTFGLTGLAIEAKESAGWPGALTAEEAAIATRYGLQELNGFPAWLPQLYEAHPSQVRDVILKEIRHELESEVPDSESHYVLDDVSWYGKWLWDPIAPLLLPQLRAERTNPTNLRRLLAIINGSSLDNATIAAIAASKAGFTRSLVFSPIWFATWVGVDPDAAIPVLTARFASMSDPSEQTQLALAFVVALVGSHSQKSYVRQAFRSVHHVKTLYMLVLRHVREKEDIQRAGKGAYSPGLRDDAQDARNSLIAFIRETPGKASFLVLQEMAEEHPDEENRPWMALYAKVRATADADIDAWTPTQVREFGKRLVAAPANHRELWYHVVDKLDALKHDLEHGDSSIASILQTVEGETEFRKYIGGWCRDHAAGRYSVPQEDELADAKRPDLRFFGVGFDAPVPVELKVADNWSGPALFERLDVQLCGDYLRDNRSSRGVFLLVFRGSGRKSWQTPDGRRCETFQRLIDELQHHWARLSSEYPGIEDIRVIGIDLTRRGIDTKAARRVAGQETSRGRGDS